MSNNKIKVRTYSVTTDEPDITVEDVEYDSVESLLSFLEEEYGSEDVYNIPIRELFEEEKGELLLEGECWFNKYVILKD